MITAREAYDKTRFQKQILQFKKDIEKGIEKAISEGKYECTIMFDIGLPDSIRNEIGDELNELGYYHTMPPYKKQPSGIPCDQADYYDYLKITWGVQDE